MPVSKLRLFGARLICVTHSSVFSVFHVCTHSHARTLTLTHPHALTDNLVMSPHRGGAVGVAEAEQARLKMLAHSLLVAAREGRVSAMPFRMCLEKGY